MNIKTLTTALLSLLIITLVSCEKKEGRNETKISNNNSGESHKNGENCMHCHKNGGDGEGWFTIAGSVYTSDQLSPAANGIVRIYSGPDGTGNILATIEVDALGNFFTTQSIDVSGGAYTSVQSTGGSEIFMDGKITSGACNSCHGLSENKIWVN